MKIKRTGIIKSYLFISILSIILGACSNPLITDLMETLENDVVEAQAGDPPVLESLNVADGAVDISTSIVLSVEFKVEMDPLTIISENITLSKAQNDVVISSAIVYDDATKTFSLTPSSTLDKEAEYKLSITTSVKSLQGAALESEIVRNFTTRYFHDTEVGIQLYYSSNNLVLNSGAPIYIEFWSSPLQYVPSNTPTTILVLSSPVITSAGKIAIPISSFPAGFSSGMFKFFHDINGSYGSDSDSDDSADSIYWYNSSGSGNMSPDDSEDSGYEFMVNQDVNDRFMFVDSGGTSIPVDGSGLPTSTPAFYSLKDNFLLSAGNGYTINYTDGSAFAADPFETAESSNNYRNIDHGTYEIARNLHSLDDVDYFTFTPASSDVYEIRVNESEFEFQVGLYSSESNMLTDSSPLATPNNGSAARVVNGTGTFLTGGSTYYIRVESPSSGMGPYEIGYFYKPATPDAAEDADDVIGTAPALTLGRSNALTRTLEAGSDTDYYSFDLVNGWDYIVEVVEDPTYFNFSAESRNIDFNLRFYKDGTPQGSFAPFPNTMIIPGSDDWNYPDTSNYHIEVQNNSTPIGDEQDLPSGQYKILITYSFDGSDQANNPNTDPTNEYDNWNEHGPASYQASVYVSPGTKGRERTIYSTTEVNPEDDVDWIRFYVADIYDYYNFKAEPIAGADGVVVDFEIYGSTTVSSEIVPDTGSGSVASSQQWVSDTSIRTASFYPLTARTYVDESNPSSEEHYWWAKVTRDSSHSGNPITGAYNFKYLTGPDWMDIDYPDSEVDVYSGTYAENNIVYTGGMDETPWIGKPFSDAGYDFETRNELIWGNMGGNPDIEIEYNSLFRRDYNYSSSGEWDGVTDKGTDFDFKWFQMPTSPPTIIPFNIVIYSRAEYTIPVKLSVWRITQAQWTTLSSDRYITEAELNATDTPTLYYTSYETGEETDKLEIIDYSDVAETDYIFMKFEIDDSRTTYVDGDGVTQNYSNSGAYQIWIFR